MGQFKNNLEASMYNIGFGGVIGVFGAVLNKKPNEKLGKVFLKGFSQGAAGGFLLFQSKKLVSKFSSTKNYTYVWPSKLINAAGISIIENAAANRKFLEQWHINIGFNRINFYTRNKFKISYRIMPFALSTTAYAFTQGKLSLNETVKTGSFIFITNKIKTKSYDFSIFGATYSNTIIISEEKSITRQEVLAHELIHVYQYENFSGVNLFFKKSIDKIRLNKKWIKAYQKIFHTDFNYLYFQGVYELYSGYETNFFENEAYWYQN